MAVNKSLVRLMAIASGTTAANLYYNQPLLALMAQGFHVTPSTMGLIPMLTQMGYATGILLFVPLGDLIERRRLIALETVRLGAEAKNIHIKTSFDHNIGLISGDSGRIQQIVWNLVSNAVKFTPSGRCVDVRLEKVDTQAQIIVSDTGKGINPEFLPFVFDYFRQEDGKITRKFGGLGLGLGIARHLTELHGGTIKVTSPGEDLGTTFTVQLPLMAAISKIAEDNSELPANSSDLSQLRILVVDDEADMRDLTLTILEEHGAQVKVAASAAEALLTLEQFRPDVLISDIGMPEMDGYMLMRQITEQFAKQGGVIPAVSEAMPKAIALTAYAGEYDRQQALSAGFQLHLSKPVEPEALARAVSQLCHNSGV